MCQLTSSLSKPSYENVKLRLKFDLFKYRVRIIYNFIFQIFFKFVIIVRLIIGMSQES